MNLKEWSYKFRVPSTSTCKTINFQSFPKKFIELDLTAHLVYNNHAKKVLDEFFSKKEEEQPTRNL